ncbi:hypothetical protein BJX65DRAFT_69752 [Aspergillus insuetus]
MADEWKQSLLIHLAAPKRQAIRTFHMDSSKASTPQLALQRCLHPKWHHHDQPSLSLIPSALLTLVLYTRPQACSLTPTPTIGHHTPSGAPDQACVAKLAARIRC